MATRAFAVTTKAHGVLKVVWTGLLNGDDGTPFEVPWVSEKSVHVKGTPGGGTPGIVLEGSNDDVTPTYITLRDPASANLSFSAEGLKQVLENPLLVRPRVTGGDGTTNWTCILICKPSIKL